MTELAEPHASKSDETRWQFWIDVGGTFTDVIARRPDGSLLRHKLLSSGVTKGIVEPGSTHTRIATSRRTECDDFWRGYRLRVLDADGSFEGEALVASSSAVEASLTLADALTQSPTAGARYELVSPESAPILAIRQLLQLRLDEPLPPVAMRLGTTRGTNALLTRSGARTAFVTTAGFGDVPRIGYQNRPRLFDLAIKKPRPLFVTSLEIAERVAVDGEVLAAPDRESMRSALRELRDDGIESLAICLLHAYRYPEHEQLIEQMAREVGFRQISCSSRVAPLVKLVPRGDTTVVDAYLTPVLGDYVATLRETLGPHSDLRFLTSAGGLVTADHFSGKDCILSGPAGGVVGFSRAAQAAGFERAIGFDMGGTSTDVSRFDGRFELEYETEKAGVRIVAPMMAIETVAAGGGSICGFDGVKLFVGPDSAGAEPGPLCYGRGGPLTVTDINVLLGRVLPEHFPFPLLPATAIETRLDELCHEIKAASGREFDRVELALGFLRIANANMAHAIRSISIAKGYDPSEYVLVAFGGAAPQHACAIAEELGMREILLHPDAGIMSALGAGLADVQRHRAAGVYRPYSHELLDKLEGVFDELTAAVRKELHAEGVADELCHVTRSLDLRYQGLDAFLTITAPVDDWAESFRQEHLRLYGYVHEGRPLEVVAARVQGTGRSSNSLARSSPVPRVSPPRPIKLHNVCFHDATRKVGVNERSALRPGQRIEGPAIVLDGLSTTLIDPGWNAEMYSGRELLLRRGDVAVIHSGLSATANDDLANAPSPVMLEIFNSHFAGIARQMGITLRNTSSSVNVKERLDFSCALFTATGDLVVNAPHIPVHLGAMAETVKRIIADNPDLAPGDVFVTNDPYRGGSHLPDVTVVTPVHDPRTKALRFFTASRAHHAEIGGITPGSMPPFSTSLAEEGVLIRNFKVIAGGQSRMDALHDLLLSGPHPTRAVEDNLADLSAQMAANRQGAGDLLKLIESQSWPVVEAYMRHIQWAAEQKMRQALSRLPDGRHAFVDYLDDGSPIAAAILVDGDSATIDFTGTGPVLAGNLNANRAIVTAAVMYCLRCLIDEDIPLNQGVLAPVSIRLPECLLNPPERDSPAQCAAVVGGNVETSQRVVDVLLGALGIAGASQGTMNNLLFGDATFGYYETICGGAGATPEADGADAVHTHMTNTRLTDAEILEQRYPVRLLEFSIHRGSGGAGQRRGGDGVVRRIQFLRSLEVSTICQRRGKYLPYGMAGGESGQAGRNHLVRADGTREELPGCASIHVCRGDILTIETPGGGGFGPPNREGS